MTKKKIARSKLRTKQRDGAAAKAEKPIPFVPADKPVDAEIKRAAERASIKPKTPRDRAARALVREVGDKIVQASDLLAEQMAQCISDKDYEALQQLGEVHHRLWDVRWGLGLTGDGIRISEADVDYVTDEVVPRAARGES